MRGRIFIPLAVSLSLACGDPEPVPFGLDRTASGTAAPEPAPGALPRFEVREWPELTTSVEIDGATWDVAPASARATFAQDLDGDGDLDALALVMLAEGGTELRFGLHEGTAFTSSTLGIAAPRPEGCELARARFESLDASLALAGLEWTCENANGGLRQSAYDVIALQDRPRALERFGFRGGRDEGLSFVAADRDSDGHVDLMVEAEVGGSSVTLGYRSTAAGLARDADAPESTIAARADEARSQIRRAPETALTVAEAALSLWDGLCRESERPRLIVGGDPGLSCGTSVGAARARAVVVAAHARLGHIVQALALERGLAAVDAQLRDAERRLVREALGALVAEAPAALTSVEATALSGEVRRSTLAFADEGHVLVLSGEPRTVGLDDGVVVPTSRIDARIVDPAGQLVLTGIERRCEGTVLVVSTDVIGTRPLELDARTPLVEPRPAPVGAPCPGLTPARRADANGFVPLGWAPQGVLLSRLDELWVVPLDVGGNAAGAATLLASDMPAPAPVLPGAATADVSAYALATPHGILLVRRGANTEVVLVRPDGYAHEGATIDVAVSPSGRRIAWIDRGHVTWAERP